MNQLPSEVPGSIPSGVGPRPLELDRATDPRGVTPRELTCTSTPTIHTSGSLPSGPFRRTAPSTAVAAALCAAVRASARAATDS